MLKLKKVYQRLKLLKIIFSDQEVAAPFSVPEVAWVTPNAPPEQQLPMELMDRELPPPPPLIRPTTTPQVNKLPIEIGRLWKKHWRQNTKKKTQPLLLFLFDKKTSIFLFWLEENSSEWKHEWTYFLMLWWFCLKICDTNFEYFVFPTTHSPLCMRLFFKKTEEKKKKKTEKIQAQAYQILMRTAKIIHNTMNSNSSSPVFVFKANN